MNMILLILFSCFTLLNPVNADKAAVTTANVNVRSGPGTNYDVLTTLPSETKVSTTPISKDGWRQVEYQDGVAWISSNYLSTPETVAENTQEETYDDVIIDDGYDNEYQMPEYESAITYEDSGVVYNPYDNFGTDGRLVIPGLDINVALNYCNPDEDEAYAQYVTDLEDSACFCYRNNTIVIGDHSSQGFSPLYDTYIGQKAHIVHADGSVINLVCTRITEHGTNDDYLYDEYGNIASFCSQPFIMYTCNPAGWWDVTITYWDYC